ncbi:MAG: hypothetical protein LBB17_01965 [Puniceicoccales bacterium]|jgi:hypothetical protein|nr:hypothetical protein [Puniceicoccales bacterium]
MNNFSHDISELIKANSPGKAQEYSANVSVDLSFNTVTSFLGENKTPPPSLESRGGDMAVAVTQVESSPSRTNDLPNMVRDVQERLDQLRQTPDDEWARVNEELRAVFVMLNDLDGDGIPDDYDKNPGETVSNVAARINKIGKYATTADNKMKIFSAIKGIAKSLDSLLNKISAMSAAVSSAFKPTTDPSASNSSDEDENPFSSKKVDKEHK